MVEGEPHNMPKVLLGILTIIIIPLLTTISYKKFEEKSHNKNVLQSLGTEIQTTRSTVEWWVDKEVGEIQMILSEELESRVPVKFWNNLNADDKQFINLCDSENHISNFYRDLEILKTTFDLDQYLIENSENREFLKAQVKYQYDHINYVYYNGEKALITINNCY